MQCAISPNSPMSNSVRLAKAAETNTIQVSFYWQCQQKRSQNTNVGVVDLLFKNTTSEVSVSIPDQIDPRVMRRLNFTCRGHYPNGWLASEKKADSLVVTINQIKNLKVVAGLFEEYTNPFMRVRDLSGRETAEKRLRRTDDDVQMEQPQELEIGKSYRIVFTSNERGMSAQLVKDVEVQSNPQETLHFDTVHTMLRDTLTKTNDLQKALELVAVDLLQNYSLAQLEALEKVIRSTQPELKNTGELITHASTYQVIIIVAEKKRCMELEKIAAESAQQNSKSFLNYVTMFKAELEKTQSLRDAMRVVQVHFNLLPLDALVNIDRQAQACTQRTVAPDALVFADARKEGNEVQSDGEMTYEFITYRALSAILSKKREIQAQERGRNANVPEESPTVVPQAPVQTRQQPAPNTQEWCAIC